MSAPEAEVVEAALQAFARAGEQGARIAEIAETAGMNKRLLYHYVGDKAALFEAALALALRHLGGDPVTGVRDRDAWRVIAFAVAGGRSVSLAPLLAAAAGESPGDGLTLARAALDALLPGLGPLLPEAAEAAASTDRRPLTANVPGGESTHMLAAGKPRIKLKHPPGPD